MERSREAATLAEESGYQEGIGRSYRLFGFVYDELGLVSNGQPASANRSSARGTETARSTQPSRRGRS